MYHDMFMKVKDSVFKNKRILVESILKSKANKAREKTLSDQFDAKRAKSKANRERKHARCEERLAQQQLLSLKRKVRNQRSENTIPKFVLHVKRFWSEISSLYLFIASLFDGFCFFLNNYLLRELLPVLSSLDLMVCIEIFFVSHSFLLCFLLTCLPFFVDFLIC